MRATSAMYLAQLVGFLFPLLLLPLLSRVMSVESVGQFFIAQSVMFFTAAVVEYGFTVSATRALASLAAPDADARARVVHGTQSAKLLLAVACVVVVLAVARLPMLGVGGTVLLLGCVAGLAQGVVPHWFFLARGGASFSFGVDVLARLAALALIVLVPAVHTSVEVIFAVLGGATLVVALVTTSGMYRRLALTPRVRVRDGWLSLTAGAHVFAVRLLTISTTTALPILMGLAFSTHDVGQYTAADRLLRAPLQLMLPLCQLMLPVVVRLHHVDEARATRLEWRLALGALTFGTLVLVLFWALGGVATRLVLGEAYVDTVAYLGVLALAAPFIAGNTLLVNVSLMSRSRERDATLVVLATSTLMVAGIAGSSVWDLRALAWTTVLAEGVALLLALLFTRRDVRSTSRRGAMSDVVPLHGERSR